MDHQPGPLVGDPRQLGDGVFEEGHLTPAQRAHQQGRRQPSIAREVADELAHVGGYRGLFDQVHRGAFARRGGQLNGGFGLQ